MTAVDSRLQKLVCRSPENSHCDKKCLTTIVNCCLNPFVLSAYFFYLHRTTLWFSHVFRGQRKDALRTNGLIDCTDFLRRALQFSLVIESIYKSTLSVSVDNFEKEFQTFTKISATFTLISFDRRLPCIRHKMK